jgi:uncharacterized integral membrane protein
MSKFRYLLLIFGMLLATQAQAVDSYRYLHVTIDTPWAIFLFLLPIVLSPFILMAIMYWRFAGRNKDQSSTDDHETGDDGTGKGRDV